jgi:hypothetical protein
MKLSLTSSTKTVRTENIIVVYNLIFKNAFYGLECYKAGRAKNEHSVDYYYAEEITDDEGEAEAFFLTMVKGKVFPVHIKDMIEDYFRA